MKLTIKITKEVLKESVTCGSFQVGQNCAIAKAVCALLPYSWTNDYCINVYRSKELFRKGDKSYASIELPNNAQRFICEFDALGRFPEKRLLLPEFSFTIDVPDSVIESIGIDQAHEIIAKSSTLELC